jgi:hypothetical protein
MAMSVTKWLMNKFKDINKDRMNRHIEIIQQQSGKSKFYIKCSLAWNFLTQGTGYTDYFRGHFIDRTKEEKKTYATAKRFYRLMAYLNDEEYIVVLGDKLIFDEVFRDYLKRDFINLRKSTPDDLREFLKGKEDSIGKKIDFLIQEMNREANTIGSKSNDKEITSMMLDLKAEIEKIREQVQNIE